MISDVLVTMRQSDVELQTTWHCLP